MRHAHSGNFALNPPENIVIESCGSDGIAYLGAIKVLESRNLLTHVKRVASTSGGAIMAALLAVGYLSEEIENLLIKAAKMDFLDHPFTKERVEAFIDDNLSLKLLKEAYDVISKCVTSASPVPLLKKIGSKLANAIWTCTGICEGRRLLNWIEKLIKDKTGRDHCTFGELADLIADGKPFKHLHVYVNKISGENTELARLSSEDPAFKDLIISEALRAASSIPVVFKPHRLIYKQQADGKYTYYSHNSSSHSYDELMKDLRTRENVAEAFYMDAGLIHPFPIGAFDQRGYLHYGVPEEEKKYHQFNRRTLGFSLYSAEEERKKVNRVESIETIGQLITGVYTAFRHAASLIYQVDCDPRDKDRIILLDDKEISSFALKTTPMYGKGAEAMDGAEKKTSEFFEKQEREVKSLMPSSPVKASTHAQPAVLERAIDQQELFMSEAQAKALLTLGCKAQEYLSWIKVLRVANTTIFALGSLLVITMPLTIPQLIGYNDETKSLKSHKLELLALDDPRFQLFTLIGQGKFEEAWAKFTRHQRFFMALMKTAIFASTFKKCLINCDNLFHYITDSWSVPGILIL